MASANQLSNSLGYTIVGDGENPRIVTAVALETVSGGFLVNFSGATNDVGSQRASYADGDLKVVGAQDDVLFNGIALNNAGSEGLVAVARRGDFLMKCGGAVSGGALVTHNASGGVLNWNGQIISGTSLLAETIVGRALTSSASGTGYYALVSLNA